MSVTLTSQELKADESDISVDHFHDGNEKLTNDDEMESETALDLNCSSNNYAETKNIQSSIIIPQDTTKNYNLSKFNKQFEICENEEGKCGESHVMPNASLQITSIEGFFNRKRGRPPKNRFVEVYKNSYQNPQAIFTSFKLEKQGLAGAAMTSENTFTTCVQQRVEASKVCVSDNKYSIHQSRHKPTHKNSTQCKRFSRVNTILANHSGDNCTCLKDVKTGASNEKPQSPVVNIMKCEYNFSGESSYYLNQCTKSLDDDKTPTKKYSEYYDSRGRELITTLSFKSGPAYKKPKMCGAPDNVTVIRAAGTFYPENSIASLCRHEEKQSIFAYGNEAAQNLCVKDTQFKATEGVESSITIGCSSVLPPQIYSILQMQHQLFSFYQQIELMMPAFAGSVTNLIDINNAADSQSPSSSCSTVTGTEMDLLRNKQLLHLILAVQKQQANQNAKIESNVEDRLAKDNTISQEILVPHSSMSVEKIPETQFQYDGDRTPSGYTRFRFNEDCGYDKCGYRQHQSHFHCNRVDCQYSFCDKTRFVQHTARHDRLDKLMGSDFQQYRATISCSYKNCPYAFNIIEDLSGTQNKRKSSHFHCLKCHFVCVDTNKVVAHRRLHSKMEFVRLAGFRKVTSNENCMMSLNGACVSKTKGTYIRKNAALSPEYSGTETLMSNCPYALRHAHYHCLFCNCSVLSRSQLLAHKHRKPVVSPAKVQKLSDEASPPPRNHARVETK